jgi:diguanylate cyclase (GGDEF)-like protein
MPDGSIWFLLIGGALCVLGALAGIMSERRRLSFVIRDQAARNTEQGRRLIDAQNERKKIEEDNKHLSSFLVVLPDVVRGLNSEHSKRSIPPHLMNSLDRIFDPEQILVFLARAKGELVLAAGKGLPRGVDPGLVVAVGQGRIGLTARKQMAMDRDELLSESAQQRQMVVSDHPGLKVDLVAPIVYEGVTLGVISVGGIGRRLLDQKRMIKLVADLGSLALSNVDLFTRLETMANRDSLTNLATKRYLNLKLSELLVRAQETHKTLSVAIFDIDHFKKLNDTYGHLAGDQVLRAVSRILKSQLRSVPARYGGEEFVVVLPDTSKEQALGMAEKIRHAIETHSFPGAFGNGGNVGGVTISGGVASCDTDGNSSNEVLAAADQALYLAKEQGRNRVLAFKGRYLSGDTEDLESVGY